MKRLCSLLCLCSVAFVGCDGSDSGDTANKTQFELRQDSSGDLAYCKTTASDGTVSNAAEGASDVPCQSLPNPKGCATLVITVDTATGQTCEVCAGADGQAISKGCGTKATVACEVVTIPEPDCVVCAYVNGTVVYSTCQPQDVCTAVACPAIARICPDGQNAVRDPNSCCGTICEPVACSAKDPCPLVRCAPGYELAGPAPGECCGQCMPSNCLSDDQCPGPGHCSVSDGACLGCNAPPGAACTDVCRGRCVAGPVVCPDILVVGPGACEGGTITSAGVDEHGCPQGELCFCPNGKPQADGNCP